ncbi:MAG TPA: hypothetical protein VFM99_00475 [Chitinophagales bacterium]|nr:hypothetical protein [Chitinophagales bacterium]
MILIADSGSTRTQWAVIDKDGRRMDDFLTQGFNPNLVSTEQIIHELNQVETVNTIKNEVHEVYFYGAGCADKTLNGIIKSALTVVFTKAKVIVNNDLHAAVYATTPADPGIVCIIGTGSNSCYYDGEKILNDDFSLGFILGDEGSGSYLGKKLVRNFFYHKLPKDLHEAFENAYQPVKRQVIEQVYRLPRPNLYLASYSEFILKHVSHPFIRKMISDGFNEFIECFVCRFDNYKTTPVHFVGSVGYYFSDILIETIKKYDIQAHKIVRTPIDELVNYHRRKIE